MHAPARAQLDVSYVRAVQPIAPAPSLERRRLRAYLALVGLDVLLVLAGFLLAGAIYLGRLPDPQALRQAYLLLPIFLTIAMYQGTYSIRTLLEWRFASLRVLLEQAMADAVDRESRIDALAAASGYDLRAFYPAP